MSTQKLPCLQRDLQTGRLIYMSVHVWAHMPSWTISRGTQRPDAAAGARPGRVRRVPGAAEGAGRRGGRGGALPGGRARCRGRAGRAGGRARRRRGGRLRPAASGSAALRRAGMPAALCAWPACPVGVGPVAACCLSHAPIGLLAPPPGRGTVMASLQSALASGRGPAVRCPALRSPGLT